MSVRPYVFLSTPFWERDGGGGNGTKLNSVGRTLLQASLGQGMVITIASGEALKSADVPKKYQGSVTKAAQGIINHLLRGEPMASPFSSSNVQDLLQALYVGGDITLFKVDDIADAPDATTARTTRSNDEISLSEELETDHPPGYLVNRVLLYVSKKTNEQLFLQLPSGDPLRIALNAEEALDNHPLWRLRQAFKLLSPSAEDWTIQRTRIITEPCWASARSSWCARR